MSKSKESYHDLPRIYLWVILLFVAAACILSSCSSGNKQLPPIRVLFIGNSYTDFNKGLDTQLMGFTPNTTASRITPGGYTLEAHFNNPDTIATIHSGKWDVVVLQEQSQTPVLSANSFFTYAYKLNQEIKAAGAETILFMTWERPDSVQAGVTTENLSKMYYSLGNQMGVKVAPVGIAFANSLKERPQLTLYTNDGHPTAQGTYLATCIFYGIIFGESPVGNSYHTGISTDEKEFLQAIAAKTLGY